MRIIWIKDITRMSISWFSDIEAYGKGFLLACEAAVVVGQLTVDPRLLDAEFHLHPFVGAPAAAAEHHVARNLVFVVGIDNYYVGHEVLSDKSSARYII